MGAHPGKLMAAADIAIAMGATAAAAVPGPANAGGEGTIAAAITAADDDTVEAMSRSRSSRRRDAIGRAIKGGRAAAVVEGIVLTRAMKTAVEDVDIVFC